MNILDQINELNNLIKLLEEVKNRAEKLKEHNKNAVHIYNVVTELLKED